MKVTSFPHKYCNHWLQTPFWAIWHVCVWRPFVQWLWPPCIRPFSEVCVLARIFWQALGIHNCQISVYWFDILTVTKFELKNLQLSHVNMRPEIIIVTAQLFFRQLYNFVWRFLNNLLYLMSYYIILNWSQMSPDPDMYWMATVWYGMLSQSWVHRHFTLKVVWWIELNWSVTELVYYINSLLFSILLLCFCSIWRNGSKIQHLH